MSNNDAYRRLYDELISLFEYNPPVVQQSDDPSSLHLPNLFYDRHLDSRLALQRVELLPSLLNSLADNVIEELEKIKASGIMLPLLSAGSNERNDFETKAFRKSRDSLNRLETKLDASSAATFYSRVSWSYCAHVGSTLALHPRSKTWRSILSFGLTQRQKSEDGYDTMVDGYVVELLRDVETGEIMIPEAILTALEEDVRVNVAEMTKRLPRLITCQFYSTSDAVVNIFRVMGNVASRRSFKPFESTVFGYPIPDQMHAVSSDGDPMLLALPLANTLRRSSRLARANEKTPSMRKRQGKTSKTAAQVGREITVKPFKRLKSDANKHIQHAWVQSVKDDTTFIVFNCGKYERIGVRHRASQTLYLSDLIDVHQCWEPAYGQIQVGIYLSVLKDAMVRVRQAVQSETKATRGRKRKHLENEESGPRPSKYRKTRFTEAQVKQAKETEKSIEAVLRESDNRNLALLRLQFSVFNSPAPTILLRKGHAVIPGRPLSRRLKAVDVMNPARKYQQDEYFEVTITSAHTAGATGIIHRAIIKVRLNDDTVHQCDAIVKIAVFPEQCNRLRHEYIVYGYLAKHGVTNVGAVYGLFEDSESGTWALIMEDVGQSLYDREGRPVNNQVTVSPQERAAFEHALSEMHKAGVRHYDVRPVNLTVNNEGKTTIIDFDMAKIGAGQHSRDREFEHLQELLRGAYYPPNQYPSPSTTADSAISDDGIFNDL